MKFIKRYWIAFIIVFAISMFLKPALCFIQLGTLFLYMSMKAILFLRKIERTGIESIGKIVSIEIHNNGHKVPVIEFTTPEGVIIKEKPIIYSTTDLQLISDLFKNYTGKEISILYDSENPSQFVILENSNSDYLTFFIFLLLGLATTIIGICAISGLIKF